MVTVMDKGKLGRSLWPLLIAALLLVTWTQPARAVDVATDHPVYAFLQTLDNRGLFDHHLSGTLPYTRLDVSALLVELESKRGQLTDVERQQLRVFRFEFFDTIEQLTGETDASEYRTAWDPISQHPWLQRAGLFHNHRDMVSFSGENWWGAGNAMIGIFNESRPFWPNADHSGTEKIFTNGYDARLHYGNLSIGASASDVGVSSDDKTFDTVRFPYQNYASDATSFDVYLTHSSFAWQNEHLLVHLGKGKNSWGETFTGSLFLSDNALPYTHVRLRGRFGPLELTAVSAKLVQSPALFDTVRISDTTVRRYYDDKWMAASRVEWWLNNSLRFGLNQQVIYGERGFDWDYAPPLSFIRGIEHYNRDRDNILLGFDFRWLPHAGLSLFGQALIDDLVFGEIGSNASAGDRNAMLLNARLSDPWMIENGTLYAEFVRIRPYVYSHKFPVNAVTHWGVNLGHPAPPNSRLIALGWGQQVAPWLRVTLHGQRLEHGENPSDTLNVGGSVLRSIRDHAPDNVALLEGDLETIDLVYAKFAIEPMYDFWVNLLVGWERERFEPATGGSTTRDGVVFSLELMWHPLL